MKREIGRVDRADFPLLKLLDIEVKIDTGAYTSSIHCKNVHVEEGILKCNFLDESHPNYHEKEFSFKSFDTRIVRSSNGISELRYRIKTQIVIFETTYDIFLTLSDREEMRYPVLLGRRFLSGKFLVDPKKANLSYKEKQNRQKH